MRCQLIEDRINTFWSFEIVNPVPYKSFTNATHHIQIEPPFSSFNLGREALFIMRERFGRQRGPSSVAAGKVTVIKLFRTSLILKQAALNGNVGLHIAYFLRMSVRKLKQA